jgi:ubiquinone biosynthesis protein
VSDYISKSIGPKAVVRDLTNTARVLARFGPRLPALVEAALIRQQQDSERPREGFKRWITLAAILGAIGAMGLAAIADWLF